MRSRADADRAPPSSRRRPSVRTACPLDCWDGCGLLVDVEDGRVVGVRGDPDHPTTRGRLCPKIRFQLDRHRSPARLTRPLVRVGCAGPGSSAAPGRGVDAADGFQTASWPAALDLVAEKLLEARRVGGSLSVLHYWDSGSMGLLKGLYRRFFDLFGGVTEPHGSLCWSAGLAAQEADFGRVLAHSPEDLANAGRIVIWGRNPADTNPHLMPFLTKARGKEVPIVVIDPLRTATVRELGAGHIAPRPGTDAVLALAAAGELIRRGTYAAAFCRERSTGFEEFARVAGGIRPAEAAAVCGIGEVDVLGLADLVASGLEPGRPTAFLLGYGLQRYASGGETVRAVDALAALGGSIGVRGGGSNYGNRHAAGVLRPLDGTEHARSRRFFDRPAFGRQVRGLADPPVTMLFCHGANPVAQLPNTNQVLPTLRGIPFRVVAELALTDTAALADVVLPVADFLEDEDLYLCAWHTRLTWAAPAVEPAGEAWPETRLVTELATRVGLTDEFRRSAAEWIALALEPLTERYPALTAGGDLMSLRGRTFPNPAAVEVPWSDGRFGTPDGRFCFGATWNVLGRWRAATVPPDGETERDQPRLHLVTPQHRFGLHSQFYGEVAKRVTPRSGLPGLFANPRTAARLGLAEGEPVKVRSAQGELAAELILDPGLREDTVYIYSGGPAGLAPGTRTASANLLTPDGLTDMGVQAAYYECVCTLEPAG